MKRPFAVRLRRYEKIGGLIWLVVYLFLIGDLISLALGLMGFPEDTLRLNRVYYILCFGVTAGLFWRFLSESLAQAAAEPLRALKGAFFGWCVYAVVQTAAGMLYSLAAPELSSPNDAAIGAMAAENFPMMAASAILLAPLTEETLLRGLVFGTLREKSRPLAYGVTAAVFAGMHVVPYLSELTAAEAALNAILYMLPSAALCGAYELGGTIWSPIVLHMAINAVGMFALRG